MAPPLALRPPPPEVVVEPDYCPEAVIEWYRITGEDKANARRNKDLVMRVKKHLCALGWEFGHAWKQKRWELRYKSPTTGKSYISLRMACQSLIQEGVVEEYYHRQQLLLSQSQSNDSNTSPRSPTSTVISSNSAELAHTRTRRRGYKKRKGVSLHDNNDNEESSPLGQTMAFEAKLEGNKRQRMRLQDDKAVTSSCDLLLHFAPTGGVGNAKVPCHSGINNIGVKTGKLFVDGINWQ